MPKRIRGVVIGLSILIAGPVVAAIISATAVSSHPAVARVSPSLASHVLPVNAIDRIPSHREEVPLAPAPTAVPTPPPTAPPTAAPKPAPKPAPARVPVAVPAVSYPPGSVEAIISAAAQRHGVDPSWMIRTASCESGLRPNAVNPSGPYYGLFQFLMSTFRAHGGTNIWDPAQQSDIAASMFAAGNSNAWPVCSHR